MKNFRRFSGPFTFALALLLSTAVGSSYAQSFPSKPVTVVVPFAAGGSADVIARLLIQQMNLGQPIIVDNKAGAGGTIGAATVARAPADGHTLLLVTAGHAGSGALYSRLTYDPVKDFAPVIGLATAPIAIAVNAGSQFKTIKDFVSEARANPDKLNCAGGGGGATVTNLAFEALKSELKLKIASVPYRGSGPAVVALLGGEIDCDSDAISTLMPQFKAGKLRALAVTSKTRSTALPEVPTIAESVLPLFEASVWYGILAPGGTPQPVLDQLNRAFSAALQSPEVQAQLKELAVEPLGSSAADFGTFIAGESTRWSALIKTLGLKAD